MVAVEMGEKRQRGIKLVPGRFRALREGRHVTHERVATILGVSARQSPRYESGEQNIPKSGWAQMCSALGVVAVFEGDPPIGDWREPDDQPSKAP